MAPDQGIMRMNLTAMDVSDREKLRAYCVNLAAKITGNTERACDSRLRCLQMIKLIDEVNGDD
jgi:hypothetical protein